MESQIEALFFANLLQTIITAIGVGLIPATIASFKGRSFFYGGFMELLCS